MGLGRLEDLQDGSMDIIKEGEGLTSMLLPSEMKKTHDLSCVKKVLCLVDGCSSDLSKCREYHRRHRVCERHSKTPVVIIKGREQRFCQQCSRFHSLGEFDDVKRSCRKRLDGHNRRRRKPQQESLYMSSQNFISDYRGGGWLQFSSPQAYGSSTTSNTGISISWPTNNNQRLESSLKKAFNETEKEFSFLTDTNSRKGIYQNPEAASSQKLVHSKGTSASNCNSIIVSDKLTHLEESTCALSLLSTNKIQAPKTMMNSSAYQQDIFQQIQPTDINLQFNEIYPYSYPRVMEDKPIGAAARNEGSNVFDCSSNGISHLCSNELYEQGRNNSFPCK
ncbi:putative squamosa promoter-binding-like protein 19 isoform X2 [Apium graveolens]